MYSNRIAKQTRAVGVLAALVACVPSVAAAGLAPAAARPADARPPPAPSVLDAPAASTAAGRAPGALDSTAAVAHALPVPRSPESALLRTAILVDDLDAARRFYVDGLGLTVRFEGDITRPAVAHQLGLAAGQTAYFVVLDTATRLREREVRSASVGLLKVDRPAPPRLDRSSGAALAVGEAMLAIETTRIEDVERRLRALGAPFVVAPTRSADGREIEMVVRDPVGTRVHVLERLAPALSPAAPAR